MHASHAARQELPGDIFVVVGGARIETTDALQHTHTQTSMTLPPTPATLAPSGWRQPATQRASPPHGGRLSAGLSVLAVLPAAAAALRWPRAAAAHLEPVVFHAHAVLLRERLSEGGGRYAGEDGVLARLARRRARPAAAPPRRKSRGGALKRAGSGPAGVLTPGGPIKRFRLT